MSKDNAATTNTLTGLYMLIGELMKSHDAMETRLNHIEDKAVILEIKVGGILSILKN